MRNSVSTLAAAVVISVGLMLGASAADLPARPYYKAAPMPAPVWSWTGFYVGVNAGYGGDRIRYPFDFPIAATSGDATLTSSGGFAGGQIGYNWQTGSWVFGVEADAAWSDITGKVAVSTAGLSVDAGTRLRWFGTARGRIGYAMDRFMVYGTGGWAYGETNSFLNANAGIFGAVALSQTNRKSGWTAGGGFEYAIMEHVSVKTEYLYLDLGSDTLFASPVFNIREHPTAHTVKAGLNWRFW